MPEEQMIGMAGELDPGSQTDPAATPGADRRSGLTIDEARALIQSRPELRCFISLSGESGLGPIVGVKDLIDVRGMVTTNGISADGLEPARYDADVIRNLRSAGAVVVGKTNLYEWGYGVSSDNRHHGAVPNPRDLNRSAGGSSSGSAAAVAAGMCDWAIGTDTAGSARIPASLCGIVGFKPSHGLISMVGVTPLSPSQDTIGILAPSVTSAAAAASILSQTDLTSGAPSGDGQVLPELAIPADWITDLDADTLAAWEQLANLREISLGSRSELFDAGVVVQGYEAARIHEAALETSPQRYGPDTTGRLQAGLAITHADYRAAQRLLSERAKELDRVLGAWGAVLMPTTAAVAPALDGPEVREPLTRYTRPFNATGHPAISVPLRTGGLAVGVQLIAGRGRDAQLLDVARRLESHLVRGQTNGIYGEVTDDV
jgi:Asp-tRNA(Asn)/Glu-tRNA(Gln) amidotransferase A subunit family amidase